MAVDDREHPVEHGRMLEAWKGRPMGHAPLLDERDERCELVDGLVILSLHARFAHERILSSTSCTPSRC